MTEPLDLEGIKKRLDDYEANPEKFLGGPPRDEPDEWLTAEVRKATAEYRALIAEVKRLRQLGAREIPELSYSIEVAQDGTTTTRRGPGA